MLRPESGLASCIARVHSARGCDPVNVLELERVAVRARESGLNVEYALFTPTAGRHTLRLAWLASISLGLSEAELIDISFKLWQDATNDERQEAAQRLAGWPLTEQVAEGIRIVD